MQVYLTLKKRRNKDGLCPIYVVVSQGRENRKMFPTPVKIEQEYWNQNRKEVRRSHPRKSDVDLILRNSLSEIRKMVDDFLKQSQDQDWGEFLEFMKGGKRLAKNQAISFWEALEEHLQTMKCQVSNDSYKDLRSLRKHLACYEESRKIALTWKKMTYRFYEDFTAFLEFEQVKPNGELGLAKNTVGKQVKNLKAFLRRSMLRSHCSQINLEGWKVEQEKGEHVFVTPDELRQIWEYDLSDDPEMETARDLFIVGAETGLRISDFTADLTYALKGRLIRYKTQKTNQEVIIPISPLLSEVMDKYNGGFPNMMKYRFQRLVKPVMRRCGIKEKVQVRKKIRGEKVTEYVEKCRLISSHTCRRSFCTNMYMKGVPVPVIMQVSGHVTQKAFMRYVQVSNQEVAEELLKEWEW